MIAFSSIADEFIQSVIYRNKDPNNGDMFTYLDYFADDYNNWDLVFYQGKNSKSKKQIFNSKNSTPGIAGVSTIAPKKQLDRSICVSGVGIAQGIEDILSENRSHIIIDPLNYDVMLYMLDEIKRFVRDENMSQFNALYRKFNLILDPKKVKLYSMSLQEACKRFPNELLGQFDISAHLFNPSQQSDEDEIQKLIFLSQSLLKQPPNQHLH